MDDEPECVFPDQQHPSDVEIWLEDGVVVLVRVGTFGPTGQFSPDEARQIRLAFQELADRAAESC